MKTLRMLGLAAGITLSAAAQAELVSTGPTTFYDTVTGSSWLKLEPFYGLSFDQMVALLPAGYTVATEAQARTLTNAAPAVPENYFADAAVMGVPSPTPQSRDLIWGFYGDGTTWLWKDAADNKWNSNAANSSGWINNNYLVDPSIGYPDLAIFAVQAVPEPMSALLLVCGLGAVAARVRRTAR